MLCTNINEIVNWTSKLIHYENNPGNGDFSYLGNAFFTQADEMQEGSATCNHPDQAYYVRDKANWLNSGNTTIFEEEGGGNSTNTPSFPKGSDIITEFNKHYGLSSFMNHGDPMHLNVASKGLDIGPRYSLLGNDSYTISGSYEENDNGFNNMTNENYPTIYYSISCLTMPFDDYLTNNGVRNMAESYTVLNQGGGPTYLGNTRFGVVDNSYKLFGYFIEEINSGNLLVGVAEANARLRMVLNDVFPPKTIIERFSHNLVGCPETPMWTGTPNNMQLSVDYTNNRVRITKADGSALSNAKVAFNHNGTYCFKDTDANGYATSNYNLNDSHETGASYPGYLPVYSKQITSNTTYTARDAIRGDIIVSGSATLTIDADLTLPKNAKIIVKDYGNLVINSGKTLTLNGNIELRNGYSNLIVNGNISIPFNTTCKIYGSGSTRLNGNVLSASGTSITFEGVNQSTKMLEVDKCCTFDTDFTSVTFKNGKIQMNNSFAELYIYSGVDNVTVDNIKVTSSSGSNNSHMGIDIRSMGNVSVNNSVFEYGEQGVYLYRSSGTSQVFVTNSTFRYCDMGLYAYNGSINVNNCSFYGNTLRAMICQSMDNYSLVKNSSFTNNNGATGIYYTGSSSTSLEVEGCNIDNNKYGILNYGPFAFDMYCSSSVNNDYYGVQAYNNASLNIDYSNLYGNKYAIEGAGSSISNRYNIFYLDEGYNDLRDNGASGSYCMYGYFYGYASGTIACDNNYWKTRIGIPVRNVDYQLFGANYYLTLSDNSPNTYKPGCSVSKSANIANSLKAEEISEDGTYREIATSIGIMTMDVAYATITNSESESGKVYSNTNQFSLLAEVLNNDLDDLNTDEKILLDKIYRTFKKRIGQLSKTEKEEQKVFDNALKCVRKLYKDIEKAENNDRSNSNKKVYAANKFKNLIDEANILRLQDDFDGAIALLSKKQNKYEDDDVCYIQELICIIEAEKQMAEQNNNGNIDDLLAACKCETKGKSGDILLEHIDHEINDKLQIMPNPVTSSSEIIIKGYKGAELAIYNSAGQKVLNSIVDSDDYIKIIDKENFTEGVYMVTVTINGKPIQNQKIVVVE